MFWISNLANYVHDNAAVGGKVSFWAFTHSGEKRPFEFLISNLENLNLSKSFIFVATTQYAFATIPRDPVSGRRVWRNNKASASFNGFINDQTVKGTGKIRQI